MYLVKKMSLDLKCFAYGESHVILRNQFNLPCFKGGSVLLLDDVTDSTVLSPSQDFLLAKALPNKS